MPIFPTDRTHVGFQASSLPYLRRLQVWVYPLVIVVIVALMIVVGMIVELMIVVGMSRR